MYVCGGDGWGAGGGGPGAGGTSCFLLPVAKMK